MTCSFTAGWLAPLVPNLRLEGGTPVRQPNPQRPESGPVTATRALGQGERGGRPKRSRGRFGRLVHLSLVLQVRTGQPGDPPVPGLLRSVVAGQVSRGWSGTQPVTLAQPVKVGDGPGDAGQAPVLR